MPTNAKRFILDLSKFGNLQPKNVAKIQRAATIELAGGLMRASPVDTGRFRGNWQVKAQGYPTGELEVENATPQGSVDIERLTVEIAKTKDIKPFTLTGIANNVPYAERLNAGWSGQAPAHFVEREIERVAQIRPKVD